MYPPLFHNPILNHRKLTGHILRRIVDVVLILVYDIVAARVHAATHPSSWLVCQHAVYMPLTCHLQVPSPCLFIL